MNYYYVGPPPSFESNYDYEAWNNGDEGAESDQKNPAESWDWCLQTMKMREWMKYICVSLTKIQ